MKKILLCLTAVFALKVIYGQTNIYQPFPSDSAVWLYIFQNGSTPPSTTYKFTQWLGDTIINSTKYTKVFTKQNSSTYVYSGGVRQDISNEKIYSIGANGVEKDVSVNQHLKVGDTLNILLCNGSMIITSIDSVHIGVKYHKRYHLRCTDSIAHGTYIVGVGEDSWGVTEYGESIACFSVKNINQYGPAPSCQLVFVSVNEISNQDGFSISPNPFCSQATLQINVPLNNATLTVDNYFGQTVAQIKNISGQAIIFNRGNLANGIYFARLTENNKIYINKLIITDK